MQFNIIPQDTPGFDDILADLESSGKKTDYNELAAAYNTMKVGDLAHVPFDKDRMSSLKAQLIKRGLVIGVDVNLYSGTVEDPTEKNEDGSEKLDADGNPIQQKDAEGNLLYGPEHAFFRRLTKTEATQVEIKQAGRKAKPAADTTTTTTATGATGAAAPADAKGATAAAAPKKGTGGKK